MSEEQQETQTEEVSEVTTEEVTGAPELPSIEDLAAELGWKPKEQWKGAEEDWKDPATFIRQGQNNTVIKQLKALQRSHEHLLKTTATTTQRLLDEQAAEINARWQQAVEDGDHKAVREAERDLRAVEAQRNRPDPLVAEFQERNDWYGTDPEATDYAASVSQRLAQQGKTVAEQLDAAEKAVRKRFPELFDDQPAPKQQRQAPQVHAPASRTATGVRRDPLAGIPKDHLAQGYDFVKMAQGRGMKYTIEDWAKTYKQEQGIAA